MQINDQVSAGANGDKYAPPNLAEVITLLEAILEGQELLLERMNVLEEKLLNITMSGEGFEVGAFGD